MFKQQLSPRSVHPYQTTVVPRSEQQLASAAQQRAKYPWAENHTPVYQVPGTDSSTSENAYHLPQYNATLREYGPPSPVYHTPYNTGTWHSFQKAEKVPLRGAPSEAFTFPQCASAFSLPLCNEPQRIVSRSPMPTSSSVSPEVPIIGACGGHCPGFEYVCYYILQIVFVVGVLTGISLCIAGIVLRRTNRNGDLGVLVYIGCLASCVCGVLLGVQCCVRREIRQRKTRANMHIPMQPILEVPAPACPLLTSTLPHTQVYRMSSPGIREDEIEQLQFDYEDSEDEFEDDDDSVADPEYLLDLEPPFEDETAKEIDGMTMNIDSIIEDLERSSSKPSPSPSPVASTLPGPSARRQTKKKLSIR